MRESLATPPRILLRSTRTTRH